MSRETGQKEIFPFNFFLLFTNLRLLYIVYFSHGPQYVAVMHLMIFRLYCDIVQWTIDENSSTIYQALSNMSAIFFPHLTHKSSYKIKV